MESPDTRGLKELGSQNTSYDYAGADHNLLERFDNPMVDGPGNSVIQVTAPEFTSLCPKTGQPDFASIVVEYTPRRYCVESKSWKLYLGSFRQHPDFHETCVRRIANHLIWLLDPYSFKIEGRFTPRGGIPFWPRIEYGRPPVVAELGNGEQLDLDRLENAIRECTEEHKSAPSSIDALVRQDDRVIKAAYIDEETDMLVINDLIETRSLH